MTRVDNGVQEREAGRSRKKMLGRSLGQSIELQLIWATWAESCLRRIDQKKPLKGVDLAVSWPRRKQVSGQVGLYQIEFDPITGHIF